MEEVDQIFLDSKNIFQAVSIARKMPKRDASHHAPALGDKISADHFESEDNHTETDHVESEGGIPAAV